MSMAIWQAWILQWQACIGWEYIMRIKLQTWNLITVSYLVTQWQGHSSIDHFFPLVVFDFCWRLRFDILDWNLDVCSCRMRSSLSCHQGYFAVIFAHEPVLSQRSVAINKVSDNVFSTKLFLRRANAWQWSSINLFNIEHHIPEFDWVCCKWLFIIWASWAGSINVFFQSLSSSLSWNVPNCFKMATQGQKT